MTKRLTIALAAAAMLQAAAPAHATIGSVISSFPIGRYYGIHREANYVYISEREYDYNYLRTYTLNGTYLGRVQLINGNTTPLRSGSRTHLGSGYVAFGDTNDRAIKVFRLSGGVPVIRLNLPTTPQNTFWNGEYYYVNTWVDKGLFRQFTRTGIYAGTWTCAGWPATMIECRGAEYAQRGNKGEGPYFVASVGSSARPMCMTTFPGGSLVRTWYGPGGAVNNLAYGDSSNPGVYGAAIWAIQYSPDYVLEFDIDARNASTVVPASLGKVKAIYR
jgi:hypothetical protein